VARLLLVAMSVGLSNFAASVGLSLSGVDRALRIRVVLLFGAFEAGMPVVGLLLGHGLAGTLGSTSRWIGGGLLVATGAWTALHRTSAGAKPATGQLVVMAAALSIDNLVVGFALGTLAVSLPVAASVIAGVSVALSLVGLEIGARLGSRVERWSEEIGGGVLVAVGAVIMAGLLD
jgi:manganese efflux pump family protein